MKKIVQILILIYSLLIMTCFPQQPGWEIIPLGTTANFNSIHFIDPFDLYICGDELLNTFSTDSGMTWQINTYLVPGPYYDVFVIAESTVVVVGNSGSILRTTDDGTSWTQINSGVSDKLLSVSFIDSLGICGGLSQTILYSSNKGATWEIAQSGFFGGGFWGASMLSQSIGFVAGENSIFQPLLGMTNDSGQNWNFSAFYLNNTEGRATGVDFTDINIGYVSGRVWDGRGAISKTLNAGDDWITNFFNNPLRDIDFPISATGLLGYTVGDSGVIYKTYDAGLNWQPQISGTNVRLNGVHFLDLDCGFAVGDNGTLLRTTTGGEPVTIVENANHSPFTFQLFQNYPNPFNPSTVISYQLPVSSNVTLKVYDVMGNEVATLINEELPAGEYKVEFNTSSIEHLPSSGIYFYQLKAGSFIQTKKMIFIK